MPAWLEHSSKVVLGNTHEVDVCSLGRLGLQIGKTMIISSIMKSNVVVAINHDATAISVELLIVPHASMSGRIVLASNEHALA